jgi:hypothetical protein
VSNLPPASLIPVANLPPVSTTQGKMVAKFAAGVVDTSAVANLPLVSLIPVVHLGLRISPRIFEKIQNAGTGGKLIHAKKQEAKNLVTLSL